MARKSFVLLVMWTVIFFVYSLSSADVPHMINYQGKLTTASGGCLNDTVQMTFSIYPDSLGSTADWSETQTEVVVKEGIFNVLLGAVDTIPSAVFDGNIKYLGVQVESDPEMRPLKPMVSVAYAYRSSRADTANVALDIPSIFMNIYQDLSTDSTDQGGYMDLKTYLIPAGVFYEGFLVFAMGYLYVPDHSGTTVARGFLNVVIGSSQRIENGARTQVHGLAGLVTGFRIPITVIYYVANEDPAWDPLDDVTVRVQGRAEGGYVSCSNLVIFGQ